MQERKKTIGELNHRMFWRKLLRIVGTVILSMLLAYLSEIFMDHYPTTLTPGEYIARREVPVPPPPNELSALGEKIVVAFAVDSACYFVLISALSVIIDMLRKPGNRSRASN